MAGGLNGAVVPCMRCAGKSLRISEGIEDDTYTCTECKHNFGIDWAEGDGPPKKPCWPPSEEWMNQFKQFVDMQTIRPKSFWQRVLEFIRIRNIKVE